jgi:hypothetical protein
VDLADYRSSASITVDAAPDTVYDLVADISRMGEWSPVCTGGRYDEDGVWFTGTNAMGESTWDTRCKVVSAERGREFAFVNHGLAGTHEMVRWGFTFRPVENGTEVTQHWEVLPDYPAGLGVAPEDAVPILDMMRGLALEGMPETLERLKAAAETL